MALFTLEPAGANGGKRITWYTLVGIVLVPLMLGGILLYALYDPTARLSTVSAAIVNNDEGAKLNGQTVPLGRQLAGGLVKGRTGSDSTVDANYNWVITNASDARSGLADGSYSAVVTIPKGFSKAATSYRNANDPRQATIDVQSSDKNRLVDGAIGNVVTSTAVSVLGNTLSQSYLSNIYVSFNTLHGKLGDAAGGAHQLASGLSQTSTGASQLASGADTLNTGAGSLATGLGQLSVGASSASDGTVKLAKGTTGLASGTHQLAGGLTKLAKGSRAGASGAGSLATGAKKLSSGAASLSSGLGQLSTGASGLDASTSQLSTGASQLATGTTQLSTGVGTVATSLQQLAAGCASAGGAAAYCANLQTLADSTSTQLAPAASTLATGAGTLATGTSQLAAGIPALTKGIASSATGASSLADGASSLSSGATKLATGSKQLASGTTKSAKGARKLDRGAAKLATGTAALAKGSKQLATGAAQSASGAQQLASGTSSLADGAGQLATGTTKLTKGTTSLASGLDTAVDQLPTYTKPERTSLAKVVADPVAAAGTAGTTLFGSSGVPLLASLSLWIGALVTYLILQAATRRALTSRRSSLALALGGYAPGLIIGVIQGVIVTGIAQIQLDLSLGDWFAFAGLGALIGASFAAIVQGAVAIVGGTGRFLVVLAGILTIAAGIISTAPDILLSTAGLLPTAAASNALLSVITGAGGIGADVTALLLWLIVGLLLSTFAVVRLRTVRARGSSALPAV